MTTIFFDLDGTLTDPKEGIIKSIQFALGEMQVEAPEAEDLLWCIGPPLRDSFEQLLGGRNGVENAMSLYRKRFGDVGLYENALYEEIPFLLSKLAKKNFELHVATSKPHFYATKIIQHFGLDQYFGKIFGAEMDGTRSDKGTLLKYALSETGCDPKRAFMVGDRKHDAIGAIKNDMTSIGVLYGYGSKDELKNAGVHHFAETPIKVFEAVVD
ncbi:HAD hydrolase-like protein [Kiloniella sp.]|uniref:HAD hydrolase-like protein n=1 Tax=Kiloniella sp. TaxID=1938587 RepID=UPI003B02A1E5